MSMETQDPRPENQQEMPEKIVSLEEIRRLMEMGPNRSVAGRRPSREEVAEWARQCIAELVTLVEAFAVAVMENPAGIFIQPQIVQTIASLDSLMAMLSDLEIERPGQKAVQEYLLAHFSKTFPKES